MPEKIALLDLTHAQLKKLLTSWGEPSFRADQVWGWLYRSLVSDFNQMRNLPKELRARLGEAAHLQTLTPLPVLSPALSSAEGPALNRTKGEAEGVESVSADGLTRKVLFALRDGETIESVFMRYERRRTVCVSTQVGCPIGCPFCATGQSGFERNLTAGEIVEQVLYFAREVRDQENGQQGPDSLITNVVFMGMGEPLLNYEATWQAIETLNDARGFGLGARRITLSTVGIVPGIQRLSQEQSQVGLAVSLHAPTDRLRDKLVPLNRRYPLRRLMAACQDYVQNTGRRITFEYALMEGVNDSLEQARRLGRLLEGLTCHVNLIPLNPIVESPYQPSSRKMALAFQRELERQGIPTTMRVGRGIDIQAGCGQLRGKKE
jgi:23S rRNA (adenine2503-C2)-methyltransferase